MWNSLPEPVSKPRRSQINDCCREPRAWIPIRNRYARAVGMEKTAIDPIEKAL
jgi:hypothetical protein